MSKANKANKANKSDEDGIEMRPQSGGRVTFATETPRNDWHALETPQNRQSPNPFEVKVQVDDMDARRQERQLDPQDNIKSLAYWQSIFGSDGGTIIGRIFFLVFLLNVLMNLDVGIIPASLTQMKSDLSFDYAQEGAVGALAYLGLTFGSLCGSYLFARYNVKWLLLLLLLFNGIASLAFAIAPYAWTLLLSRFLMGFTHAFLVVFGPVWVDGFAPQDRKAWYLALLQLGNPLGILLGYILGILFVRYLPNNHISNWAIWRVPFLAQGIFILLLGILFILLKSEWLESEIMIRARLGQKNKDKTINILTPAAGRLAPPSRAGSERKSGESDQKESQPSSPTIPPVGGTAIEEANAAARSTSSSLASNASSASSSDSEPNPFSGSTPPRQSVSPMMPGIPESDGPNPVIIGGHELDPTVYKHKTRFAQNSSLLAFTGAVPPESADLSSLTAEWSSALPPSHPQAFSLTTPAAHSAAALRSAASTSASTMIAVRPNRANTLNNSLREWRLYSEEATKFPEDELMNTNSVVGHTQQIKIILSRKIYTYTLLALCSLFFLVTGLQFWITAFLATELNADLMAAGIAFVIIFPTASVSGVLFGSWLNSTLGGYHGVYQTLRTLRVNCGLNLILFVFASFCGFLPNFYGLVVVLWIVLFFCASLVPSSTGVLLSSIPIHLREISAAVTQFSFNIFGYFLGPLLGGIIAQIFSSLSAAIYFIFLSSVFSLLFMGLAYRAAFAAWCDDIKNEEKNEEKRKEKEKRDIEQLQRKRQAEEDEEQEKKKRQAEKEAKQKKEAESDEEAEESVGDMFTPPSPTAEQHEEHIPAVKSPPRSAASPAAAAGEFHIQVNSESVQAADVYARPLGAAEVGPPSSDDTLSWQAKSRLYNKSISQQSK